MRRRKPCYVVRCFCLATNTLFCFNVLHIYLFVFTTKAALFTNNVKTWLRLAPSVFASLVFNVFHSGFFMDNAKAALAARNAEGWSYHFAPIVSTS